MLVAEPPPPPTLREARVSTVMVVQQTADLLDGRLSVSRHCPIKGISRICQARIRGPEPLRLRVKVRYSRNQQNILISARIVDR